MKNKHLNFFNFYAESESVKHQENNLTRALAICLQYEPLFLYNFLKEIVKEDLHPQLHLISDEDEIQVEIQQSISDLELAEKVYAVSITENKLKLDNYRELAAWRNEEPITDMVIRFKDTLIIIEVKRSSENCLAQLKGQLEKYKEVIGEDVSETPVSISWKQIIRLADDISNFCTMINQPANILQNFTAFIRNRYPRWDQPIPLDSVPFLIGDKINYHPIYKRLYTVLQKHYGVELISSKGRTSIPLKMGWAAEALIDPSKGNDNKQYLKIRVFPGNTKGQGWSLFHSPAGLDWTNKTSLEVDGKVYEFKAEPYVKFANTYGTYLFEFMPVRDMQPYADNFKSKKAFYRLSKRWKKEDAAKLESILNDLTDNNWLNQVGKDWKNKFINSGRSMINVSLGFAVYVLIPYNEVRKIDKDMNDTESLGQYFERIIDELKNLINGKKSSEQNSIKLTTSEVIEQ